MNTRGQTALAHDRVTVALRLSAGQCGSVKPEGMMQSAVRVVHGDPGGGIPGGLGVMLQDASVEDKSSESGECIGHNGDMGLSGALVVRTSYLSAEGVETGTLSNAAYIEALAARVVLNLLCREGAELLTVSHGAAGSGKSVGLFGHTSLSGLACTPVGLLTAVLERIFSLTNVYATRVGISVVTLRPSLAKQNSIMTSELHCNATSSADHGEEIEPSAGCEGFLRASEAVPFEAVDLLSGITDRSSPTGCFMEDYADIPAVCYVRCGSPQETLLVLRKALSNTLGCKSLPDNSGSVMVNQMDDGHSQATAAGSSSDFLFNHTSSSGSHILVTLLFRIKRNCKGDSDSVGSGSRDTFSIWRLWDLCGVPAWMGDDASAHAAFSTHTAVCQMARRFRYRDALQGGWWFTLSSAVGMGPPQHISEIIPLVSTVGQLTSDDKDDLEHCELPCGGVDKAAAMIEACMQHSSSSVLWMCSLRFDSFYDDVNEDILEAAAALSSCGDTINGNVITELRRRRRQQNLDAAERVMKFFAVSFSTFCRQSPEVSGYCSKVELPSESNTTSASTIVPTSVRSVDATSPRRPRLLSPTVAAEQRQTSTIPVAVVVSSSTLSSGTGDGTGGSPWSEFVDRSSCLEAQQPVSQVQDSTKGEVAPPLVFLPDPSQGLTAPHHLHVREASPLPLVAPMQPDASETMVASESDATTLSAITLENISRITASQALSRISPKDGGEESCSVQYLVGARIANECELRVKSPELPEEPSSLVSQRSTSLKRGVNELIDGSLKYQPSGARQLSFFMHRIRQLEHENDELRAQLFSLSHLHNNSAGTHTSIASTTKAAMEEPVSLDAGTLRDTSQIYTVSNAKHGDSSHSKHGSETSFRLISNADFQLRHEAPCALTGLPITSSEKRVTGHGYISGDSVGTACVNVDNGTVVSAPCTHGEYCVCASASVIAQVERILMDATRLAPVCHDSPVQQSEKGS
ncbi:hypothetical protein ERJ75_000058800 [Trypanosoma vivax]|uniref:Kinesin motor domain-containing protein n=1 Tax=Trypanosoma vivax (strain Y486) TaxID=1055687 RepID=G0TZD4_TRYVY|nr:hypothetical protein ERJ75_000058800 [Trypanosoma vivax]CCC49337.1 conserved hypothetical protein [Trypanosoma vivax Y486]